MARRFRAPAADRAVLADPPFAELPGLIERNRRLFDTTAVRIDGVPLRELRALARAEVVSTGEGSRAAGRGPSAESPLLIGGHQPELSHPGVWVKHFALNGLARHVGGIPLNLIADTDTLKTPAVRLPAWERWSPDAVHAVSVPFDAPGDPRPYSAADIRDPARFARFPEEVARLTDNWGYAPLLRSVWPTVRDAPGPIGERFTAARLRVEREWGCENVELRVSHLARTAAFRHFVRHLAADLPRFREAYNAAVRRYREANDIRSRHHPAPELAAGEAPFWAWDAGRDRRVPATADDVDVVPRALTLTLFARLCVGDLFVHGIGGGKYDEVTDDLFRSYFGIDPPAYQVLSATLHLPLPTFPAADVPALERLDRELHWNAVRHLPASDGLVQEYRAVTAEEPATKRGRRERCRTLRRLAELLRPKLADRRAQVRRELESARRAAAANAVLTRRDYSWVLYPEETLRPFLTAFLKGERGASAP